MYCSLINLNAILFTTIWVLVIMVISLRLVMYAFIHPEFETSNKTMSKHSNFDPFFLPNTKWMKCVSLFENNIVTFIKFLCCVLINYLITHMFWANILSSMHQVPEFLFVFIEDIFIYEKYYQNTRLITNWNDLSATWVPAHRPTSRLTTQYTIATLL